MRGVQVVAATVEATRASNGSAPRRAGVRGTTLESTVVFDKEGLVQVLGDVAALCGSSATRQLSGDWRGRFSNVSSRRVLSMVDPVALDLRQGNVTRRLASARGPFLLDALLVHGMAMEIEHGAE